jgi:hypothetical protein
MISHPWKGIFECLAISALVLASHGLAQERHGSPDGLYARPDTGPESPGSRSSQAFLGSGGSQGQPTDYEAEPIWIAILAGAGLFASLATGGYVWWSRLQSSRAERAVLLAIRQGPAAKPDDTEKQDTLPQRRAA